MPQPTRPSSARPTSSAPFTHMAPFYDALYKAKGKNYPAEADYIHQVIRQHNPAAQTLLDAACGTAEHLLHLAQHYQTTGLDLSAPMLEVARAKLPRTLFHQADLTDPASLHRLPSFDVITCLFAAIAYLPDVSALHAAVRSLTQHLNPNALLLIEPGVMPHNAAPPTTSTLTTTLNQIIITRTTSATLLHNNADQPESPSAITITFEHTLSQPHHPDQHFTEQHTLQLFTQADYEAALIAAGLTHTFDPVGPANLGLFIAHKPAD